MDDPALVTWLAITRALHIGSCLLIAGVWFFDWVIVARSAAEWRRIAVALLQIATPVALFSGIAWFVLVTANMCDLPVSTAVHSFRDLRLVWTHTRFGRTWQIHSVCWLVVAVSAFAWKRFDRARWFGLIAGTGLIVGLAWAGHGDTGPQARWHFTADIMHLLASAVWPTGLLPLVLMLTLLPEDRADILHRMIRRFSNASLAAVGALTATGLVSSWCLLGSFGALFSTNYGRVLSVKIVLFVVMVVLGAVNLLVTKPRLIDDPSAAKTLRWTVLVELVMATLLIAIVGLLGVLEPARN